ncbi:HAD family hydrolase [Nocardiopsis suaedae]|uniref:HAD hydrolase-like protein n=1 Tax=Nocardiopsis suaedae TaxID=3018444 RepID=A0ABT4TQZ2_9ACTN|nr:HAD family hydrolase [Nocardiopsis suaedae]MDA2807082.1 HAD hydrolase-like protein [Nocardiopsis suaedae]
MPVLRPSAFVFDLFDTLVPLEPLEWRLREAGVPRVLMRRWWDHLLRDGFALAAAGGSAPFRQVARNALADITGHQVAGAAAEAVVGALAELEPRADAAEALRAARSAGEARVAVLDNADAATVRALLEHGGCAGLVDVVVEAGSAGAWKPAPAPYLAAAEACGAAPSRTALVTSHGWDVHGAHAAGLVTAWSSHAEWRFPAVYTAPDASGPSPVAVVEALLSGEGRVPAE